MLAAFRPPFNRLIQPVVRLLGGRAPVAPSAAPALDPAPPADPCPLAHPDCPLPPWVLDDPVVQKYRDLLGPLPWADFPERPTDRPWPGKTPAPRAPFAAAYLIKLHEQKRYMSDLRTYL